MTALWHATEGEGPELVMLHGWALHSECWGEILDRLRVRFRVTLIDLPGHGRSQAAQPAADLDAWARAALDVAPERALWLGWSIGGMVALCAALDAPARVERLVTVAASPRFLRGQDWPDAQSPDALDCVVTGLSTDYRRTVDDFLALQVLGSERAQATLRGLKRRAASLPEPSAAALAAGLRILHDADLRDGVSRLAAPLLAVMGRLDRLVPPVAGEWLASRVPDGRCTVLPRAAHAPFLSHPEDFCTAVEGFLA